MTEDTNLKEIVVIYPLLTSYIIPVFQRMANSGRVLLNVVYSLPLSSEGFGEQRPFEHPNVSWMQVEDKHPFGNRFGMYQKGIIDTIITIKPDAILIWSNPRYLSFWLVLLVGRLLKIPVYPRGHGLFKKKKVSLLQKFMYNIIIGLSKRYICYTPQVRESLLEISIPESKLVIDYNTLDVECPVRPEEKTGDENGILFIGRLRQLCDIEILIEAVKIARKALDIDLHIIGGGFLADYVQEAASQYTWISFHGKIFDDKDISEISRLCRFGCQPGYTGLSVVHLMALSLPVITHGDLYAHMGPEPEYVDHGENGLLYKRRRGVNGLVSIIEQMFAKPKDQMRLMQQKAFNTYSGLSLPPYYMRLLAIIFEEDLSEKMINYVHRNGAIN